MAAATSGINTIKLLYNNVAHLLKGNSSEKAETLIRVNYPCPAKIRKIKQLIEGEEG
jgi:hypothetical protein